MDNRRILGSSAQAQLLQKLVQQAGASRVPVLICGEPGAGRTFLARLLYEEGGSVGVFEQRTCAGLRDAVLRSELLSCIESARAGTFFLDGVEQASIPMQTELAGTAQTHNVRLIAATSAIVDERIAPEIFGMRIMVAALRERRSDIPVLAADFVKQFALKYGKPVRRVDPAAMKKLMAYPWPGNIRELKDAVERAVLLADNGLLRLEEFASLVTADEGRAFELVIPSTIQQIEREAILRTLDYAGGSTTAAARLLDMSVRKVQYKLKQYRSAEQPGARAKAGGVSGG